MVTTGDFKTNWRGGSTVVVVTGWLFALTKETFLAEPAWGTATGVGCSQRSRDVSVVGFFRQLNRCWTPCGDCWHVVIVGMW